MRSHKKYSMYRVLTIRPGYVYACLNPTTGALGLYCGYDQYMAYQTAWRAVRLGRRRLPQQAPYYTCGGPDRRCTRANYRAVAFGRKAMIDCETFLPMPYVPGESGL